MPDTPREMFMKLHKKWVRLPRHDHVEKRQTCAVDQPLGGWQAGKAERGISWSGWAQQKRKILNPKRDHRWFKVGKVPGSRRIDHPSPGIGQGPTVGGLTVKLPPVKVTVEVSLANRQNHLFSVSYWGEKTISIWCKYHVPSPAEAAV